MIAAIRLARMMAEHRQLLFATTRIEFQRRYAGSALGLFWVVLNPLLFLSVYLFLFLVVFQIRLPGLSNLGYVIMVFSGLVPFLTAMEVASSGAMALKQNMHLIKNVIMPVDLIPVRTVLVAMATQCVGLVVLLVISGLGDALDWKALFMLPLALAIQFVFLLGLALIFAPLGVLIPDINHVIGTFLLFLLFISPIAFDQTMVPDALRLVTQLNPASYMIETFRMSLLAYEPIYWETIGVFALIAAAALLAGAALMQRFKAVVVDYE